MHPKLQQAIVAARAGKTQEAKYLLTELIEDDPDQANAWFLLGNLTDSETRTESYLKQALALDPNHSLAKQRLRESGVFDAAAVPEVGQPEEIPSVKEDESIPSWLRDSEMKGQQAEEEPATSADLPDWLQDLDKSKQQQEQDQTLVDLEAEALPAVEKIEKEKLAEKQPVAVPQKEKPVTAVARPKAKKGGDVWLSRLLVLLIIIAIIVIGFLVYLLLFAA